MQPTLPKSTLPTPALAHARVLLAGVGNIGSPLAPRLARKGVRFFRIVDRDVVEARNIANQAFDGARDVGRPKAEVIAERLRTFYPHVEVESIVADLEDVPLGKFEDVDVVLGGLDSLRARQILVSERAYPQNVPVVDGAVDDEGALGKVQVLMPGAACLECSWGPPHYLAATRDTPCRPHGNASGPPTNAPAALGAAVGRLMVNEAVKLVTCGPPADSYEVAFDLVARRRCTSRLTRAAGCRFDHTIVREKFPLRVEFAAARVGDLLATVSEAVADGQSLRIEFRRRVFDAGLFGGDRWLEPLHLAAYAPRRLAELGLTRFDRVRVSSGERTVFIDLDR
jgi:molybdopterin/thiamine biosynthesis adenylyltransferase